MNASRRVWSICKDGLPVALHWCVCLVLCASALSCLTQRMWGWTP